MNEQEARSIERQLTELLPGCLVEAYRTAFPDYTKKEFVSTWMVSVYSSMEKYGNLACVIRDQKNRDAFLTVCSSYYNRRREIEEIKWSEESEKEYQEQTHQEQVRQGKAFTDQNGFTVIDGGVYGVDRQGDLYDLESQEVFRPSEY